MQCDHCPAPGSCYSSLYFDRGWGLSVSAASSKWLQFPAENRTSRFEAILPGCSPDTAPQLPFPHFSCSPVRKFAIICKKSILTLHSLELSALFANTRSMTLEIFSPRKRRKASTCQSVILGITFHKGTQSSPCLNPSRLGRDGEQRGRVSKWLRWAVKGSSNYYVCRLHVRQRLQNVKEWRKLYSSWWRSLRSASSWLTDFLVNWILTCLLRKLVQGRVCKEHGKKNTSF